MSNRFHQKMLPLILNLFLATLVFVICNRQITNGKKSLDLANLRDQEFLVRKEQEILLKVYSYVGILEEKISFFKNYISEFSLEDNLHFEGNAGDLLDEEHLPKTGFLGYKLLERVRKFEELRLHGLETFAGGVFIKDELEELLNEFNFPNGTDVEFLIRSLIQLTGLFRLDLDDVEVGKILDVNTRSGLEREHFYELGLYMLKSQLLEPAIDFLDKARILARQAQTKDLENYEKAFEFAASKHDETMDKHPNNPYLYPRKISLTPHLNYTNRGKLGSIRTDERHMVEEEEMVEDYEMCRTTFYPKLHGQSNFYKISFTRENFIEKCYLSSSLHPYWILNPMKVEVFSKDPFLVLYHDVLTTNQINRMKENIAPQLTRSVIVKPESLDPDPSRVSSTALPNPNDAFLWNGKAQLYTGLKAMKPDQAESLQVTSYPNGGFFEPHFDAFQSYPNPTSLTNELLRHGDRIVTFMFYLTTPELGGATGFPRLNLNVQPVQGAALLWYNVHPNGSYDDRLFHTGCPVLLGTKWIATKWILSDAQMFLRKCPKEENDLDFNPWFYDHYRF